MTEPPNSSQANATEANGSATSPNGTTASNAAIASSESDQISITREEFEQAVVGSAGPYTLTGNLDQTSSSNFLVSVITLTAVAVMILGLALDNIWVGYISAFVVLFASLRMIWPSWGTVWTSLIPPVWRNLIIASFGILAAI
ncbi:MAG: pentapeptide repeat-containing protein, partial [Cyanobacteriota bacterium]|nr:pentapeptide repeat-containing protein [Cyanobacteriota bacterium]